MPRKRESPGQDAVVGRAPAAPPPLFLTPLIGRGRELADVRALLGAGRLVTLVGAGGSGKTRLAAAVAAAAEGELAERLAWVELAPLSDPALLTVHVAGVFNVRETSDEPVRDALAHAIGARPALLVLDNCEHLVDACAELVDALLRRCPALRVLATSQQALGVPGEQTWVVPPLALPAPGEEANAAGCSAIQLFVRRAGERVATFALTDANRDAVVRICRRLDGMPLAIELAAARVSVLTPEQLADGLDDVFAMLSGGARAALPRHRTLRALIDWSYGLLLPDERRLFERLAVFHGGFTLESAQGVAAFGPLERRAVLDLLAGLVDKSLVMVQERGDGAARYTLLETVRQYADERLRGGADRPELERRHALHFLELAERAATRMHHAEQMPWLARLDAEHDNLRAALHWTLAADAELALRFCVAMRDFWRIRGHLSEGLGWMQEALAPRAGPDVLRARVLVGAGTLARRLGHHEEFRAHVVEGEALARRTGDPAALADALTQRGVHLRDLGEPAAARSLLDEAIALWRSTGDGWGLTIALCARSAIAHAEGDLPGARALRLEAAEIARQAHDREGEAFALIGLGELARMEGDVAGARAHYERCMTVFRELGDSWHVAALLHNQGWLAAESGNYDEARRSFAAALALFDSERALILAPCLAGLARLLAETGDAEYAAVAFASAVTSMERTRIRPAGGDLPSFQRTHAVIERALGAEAFARAWAAGAATSPAEHVRRALALLETRLTTDALPARSDDPAPAHAPRDGAALRVRALGPLEVHADGEALDAERFGSRKARELLLLLLTARDGLTRDQVGLAFWPDASPAEVKNRFHVSLHRLRRALGHPEWVASADDRYRIAPGLAVDFDAARFEAEMDAALRAAARGDCSPERLGAALAVYRGDFLEHESFGDWHLETRDRLRHRYLEGLLRQGDLLARAGRLADAAAAYRALLARDPLHEQACRRLMECHARAGERAEALRQYERLAATLRDEHGAEPHPETTALYALLRAPGAPPVPQATPR